MLRKDIYMNLCPQLDHFLMKVWKHGFTRLREQRINLRFDLLSDTSHLLHHAFTLFGLLCRLWSSFLLAILWQNPQSSKKSQMVQEVETRRLLTKILKRHKGPSNLGNFRCYWLCVWFTIVNGCDLWAGLCVWFTIVERNSQNQSGKIKKKRFRGPCKALP